METERSNKGKKKSKKELRYKSMNYHGCTEEQVERILALGLTPWQFENIKGNYYTRERGYAAHKEAVLKILEKRKAEGKPIPKPNENGSILDHESSLFFGVTGAIGALLFSGGWILSAGILGKMLSNITRDKRKNAEEYDKFKEEWKRRDK